MYLNLANKPFISGLGTDKEYALIAVNHCLEDAEVTIKFNSVQKIHHDAYKNNVLTLKLIQSDGMILSWKK